jgi:glycosyltransferase involved in cell wall biosynthesis
MTDSPCCDDLVSVVMPTHNRADRLMWALRSVLDQDHRSIEVIVVDDGSRDRTREVLAAVDDPRLRPIHLSPNGGVAAARNAGIAAATGRWVAFIDDDDYWLPTKLSAQIEAMRSTDARWCITSALEVSPSLEPLAFAHVSPGMTSEWLLGSNVIPGGCSGVMVERALVVETGGFDTSLSMFADWELWTRLIIAAGPPAMVHAPQVLYVVHPGQMSADQSRSERELATIRDRFREQRRSERGGSGDRFPMVAWAVRRARVNAGLRTGLRTAWHVRGMVPREMVLPVVIIHLAPNWARGVRARRQTAQLRTRRDVIEALAGVEPPTKGEQTCPTGS